MDGLWAFLLAAVLSFWGSLQLGLVNVAVIQTAIKTNKLNAVLMAIGGVLPEIPYALIPAFFSNYVNVELKPYHQSIGIGVGIVLIVLGISMFIASKKKKKVKVEKPATSMFFFKGLAIGILNPQLLIYWAGVVLLVETGSFNFFGKQWVHFDANTFPSPRITFAIGAAVGALAILLIFIRLASKYKNQITDLLGGRLNEIMSYFFMVLGVFVIIKNVI